MRRERGRGFRRDRNAMALERARLIVAERTGVDPSQVSDKEAGKWRNAGGNKSPEPYKAYGRLDRPRAGRGNRGNARHRYLLAA